MFIASENMTQEWLMWKNKQDSKLLKQPKPFKEVVSKHKRVKSDMNAMSKKVFPDNLQVTNTAQQKIKNASKKDLKSTSKFSRPLSQI